jgi:hypothetical protein
MALIISEFQAISKQARLYESHIRLSHSMCKFRSVTNIHVAYTTGKSRAQLRSTESIYFSNIMKNIHFYEQQVSGGEKNRAPPPIHGVSS